MRILTDIQGVGPALASACIANKYHTVAEIAEATPLELAVISGISEIKAKLMIASAILLINEQPLKKATKEKLNGTRTKSSDGANTDTPAIPNNTIKTKERKLSKSKDKIAKKEDKEVKAKDKKESGKKAERKIEKKIKKLKKKIKKLIKKLD